MAIEYIDPQEIQRKSFEIITEKLSESGFISQNRPDKDQLSVIIRCIHTTADFDYAKNLVFSNDAIERFGNLVQNKAIIFTDTNMALAGINRKKAEEYGCTLKCFMADPDVEKEAKQRGITRASVSMEKAAALGENVIFAIGNAPTALITLKKLYDNGYKPAFIIGVPVGFVNVVEAKEMIIETDIPYIISRGNKGGSTVAAAIVNALFETYA